MTIRHKTGTSEIKVINRSGNSLKNDSKEARAHYLRSGGIQVPFQVRVRQIEDNASSREARDRRELKKNGSACATTDGAQRLDADICADSKPQLRREGAALSAPERQWTYDE